MDKQDNYTKERLLLIAKKEFLSSGFNKVSMRDISKATGMALGNIYYYFKTKDDLYVAILRPQIEQFKNIIEEHNSIETAKLDPFDTSIIINNKSWHFYNLLEKNRKELFLLFYMSQGSSLEHFSEYLTDEFDKMGIEYIHNYLKYHKKEDVEIEPLFVHVYASMIVTTIKEIVRLDKIPKKTYERFSESMMRFTLNGWKELMRAC